MGGGVKYLIRPKGSKVVYTIWATQKNIVLRVGPYFHKKVELYVTMNNTALQGCVVGFN